MPLPNKLMSARMIDATPGSSIDNKVGELEQAICDVLGLPLDIELTVAVTAIDTTGRLTAAVRFAAAQDPTHATPVVAGPRLRDTTTGVDDEALLVVEDGYLRIYENTGTEAVPIWTERNKMNLTTGAWDLATAANTFVSLTDTPSALGTANAGKAPSVNAAGTALELINPPACSLTASGTQNVATATWAAIIFGTETFDNASLHSTSVDTTRITVSAAGVYLLVAAVKFAANAAGTRDLFVKVNGATYLQPYFQGFGHATNPTVVETMVIANLSAGDYVEAVVIQDSGSTLNIPFANFAAVRIR